MSTGSQPYLHAESNFLAGREQDPAVQTSPSFVALSSSLRRLLLLAETTAPRLLCATLEGEPGTGKRLFAHTLHQKSLAANYPFRRHDAREWLASDVDASEFLGALYLDRVDLLAASGQGLLLNLVKHLQDNKPPHFLLLTSSHSSLRSLASQNFFLPDLAFRLASVRFPLPPLRERKEDIAPLAQALVDRICRHYGQPTAILAAGSLPKLLQYSWPGNVRELATVLENAILQSTTGVLRPGDLILSETAPTAIHPLNREKTPSSQPEQTASHAVSLPSQDLSLNTVIQSHIQHVLQLNRGNKLRAARQLGISRSTLYRMLAGESFTSHTSPLLPASDSDQAAR